MTSPEYEVKILGFWKEKNIYEKVQQKNKDGKLFNTIDGPPFPTGEPHVGHIRNWAIKDSVLRLKRFQGYNIYARDGYDVQGLPVENKVQGKLGIKTAEDIKEFGEDNFIKECRKYVAENIDNMTEVRNRFGLWMDRDYYHTSHPEYLSLAWRFFKTAHEKGLLYKDYKTVAWCPNDETTLSDYEIKDEYTTLDDPSIYVKFPLKNPTSQYTESFVIWTTTPWTLQSNLAIAVNPNFNYAKVLVELEGNKEVLIVAELLIDTFLQTISKSVNVKKLEILDVVKGANLEGVEYSHIYIDETPSQQEFISQRDSFPHIHKIVLADFVELGEGEDIFEKLEKKGYKHETDKKVETETKKEGKKSDGTGLVHIAPGHGFDDYEVGRKYGLPIFSPIGPNGTFTEGKYKGKYFKDVDPIAIEYLKGKGFLLHSAIKTHRYPCCWRCKTPIVYRATDQWWIRRSAMTQGVLSENKNVQWTPEFAKGNFSNLYESSGDWAISRQRYWGIPLPIWEDEDGNYEVLGSKEELEERSGKKLDDIHRDDIKDIILTNKESGKPMKPVPYIADVWFDSGCASFASHYGEGLSFDEIIKKYYPIKWITEGQDQIRGWFSSLFSVGHVLTDKAPYNQVLFQQFVMAKDGTKMSKSKGNGVDGKEALELWGADKTRFYLLYKRAPQDQINFDKDEMNLIHGFFTTLENSFKFVNSYLSEHSLSNFPMLNLNSLAVEDKWILYKHNIFIRDFTHLYEQFKFNQALKLLEEFVVRDFSKTYLKLVKERTSERDENLLQIFSKVMKDVLILFSLPSPFKAEEIYQELILPNKKESLFLENSPEEDLSLIKIVESKEIHENFDLAQDVVQAILNAREKAKIGVRWPLGKVTILSSNDHLSDKLKEFEKLIRDLTNIAKISYDSGEVDFEYVIKPNFQTLKEDFGNPTPGIKAINLSKHYIREDLKKGIYKNQYDGMTLDLTRHIIKELELKGEFTSSDFSIGSLILHTHQDEILLEEGYLRELIRRVQSMRKDLGLQKQDLVSLSFEGSDSYFDELVSNWEGFIMKKVGASEVRQKHVANSEEYLIKEKVLKVSIVKEEK